MNIGHFKVMLARMVLKLHRVVLLAALTVALVGTGFAHRISSPQDEALAFALANGVSLADICGGDLENGRHGAAECQACQIAGTADLPSLAGAPIDLDLAVHAAVVARVEFWSILQEPDPAHRPQGPPVA